MTNVACVAGSISRIGRLASSVTEQDTPDPYNFTGSGSVSKVEIDPDPDPTETIKNRKYVPTKNRDY